MNGRKRMSESKNRTVAVYQALRRAILEQALQPGAKLPEDAIAEQFAVSRTVARRALEMLAADEIVELKPNRGASVAKPSLEEAYDTFRVRIDIENLIVERVVGTLTPKDVKILENSVAAEERSHREGREDYIRHAAEFHILVAEMAKSPLLLRYLRSLVSRSALILGIYGRPSWTSCSVQEHRELIAALTGNNVSRAQKLMRTHLDAVLTRALEGAHVDTRRGIRDILAAYSDAS
jgi:DNA-binding GntR family transcriptional regulator